MLICAPYGKTGTRECSSFYSQGSGALGKQLRRGDAVWSLAAGWRCRHRAVPAIQRGCRRLATTCCISRTRPLARPTAEQQHVRCMYACTAGAHGRCTVVTWSVAHGGYFPVMRWPAVGPANGHLAGLTVVLLRRCCPCPAATRPLHGSCEGGPSPQQLWCASHKHLQPHRLPLPPPLPSPPRRHHCCCCRCYCGCCYHGRFAALPHRVYCCVQQQRTRGPGQGAGPGHGTQLATRGLRPPVASVVHCPAPAVCRQLKTATGNNVPVGYSAARPAVPAQPRRQAVLLLVASPCCARRTAAAVAAAPTAAATTAVRNPSCPKLPA